MKAADIRYVVNEDKRTVVAILEGCGDDALNEIISRGHYCNRSLSVYPRSWLVNMPDTIRAVAKCYPSDIFNEEVGKRVARRKLIKHYYKLKALAIMKHVQDMQTVADRLLSYVDKICEEELSEE